MIYGNDIGEKQVGPTAESNSILKFISCIRNQFGLKYFCIQTNVGFRNIVEKTSEKILVLKCFLVKKILGPKRYWFKKNLGSEKFGPEKILASERILSQIISSLGLS